MSEGTPAALAPSDRGPWSAIFGAYGRRLRFPVVANVSLMVLFPGGVGLLADMAWARAYCSVVGTIFLMIWTGLVSGHLKLVLARPETRLLPGYPRAQVLGAASVVLPVFALSLFFHGMAGFGPPAALALSLLSASLCWTVPYFLTQGYVVLIIAPQLLLLTGEPRLRGWWRSFGPGWSETWTLLAIGLSAAVIGLTVHRMLRLNESFSEYARDPSLGWRPGRPIDQDIPFAGLLNRFLPGVGRYRVSGLRSRYRAGLPFRVQLWRKGMSRTFPMVTGLSLAGLIVIIGALLRFHPADGPLLQASLLGLYLMFFALVRPAYLHRRKERLSYEALYPSTRERMLTELGAATALDLAETWLFLWLGTVLVWVLGLFPLVTGRTLMSCACYSLGATILGGGIVPWAVRVRGNSVFLLTLYLGTTGFAAPVGVPLARGPGLEAVAAWAAGSAVLAGLGVALGAAGYRAWCRLELGRI
jgi:hypothetical protein